MTTSPKEIVLPVGCSAEYNTCGSCFFFKREDYGDYMRMQGQCGFKLPPTMERYAPFVYPKDEEYTVGPRPKNDTDRCDCYRSSGQVYIVQRKIVP